MQNNFVERGRQEIASNPRVANRRERFRKFCAYSTGAYFIFTAYMLFSPRPPVPEPLQFSLSVAHLGAFGVLGIGVAAGRRLRGGWSVFFWGVLLTIWGLVSEIVQPYTGRCFQWEDVVQDAIGALIGLTIATRARSRFERRREEDGAVVRPNGNADEYAADR